MHQTPLEQAIDVTAPPELLGQLAVNDDVAVRKAVTINPNTSTDVLISLADEFPNAFFSNPVLSLLILENPNFVVEIPYWTLINLLRQPNVPDFFLSGAAMHSNPEVLRVVAKHYQTPLSALEMMARCKDSNLGMIIAQRQDVTEQILLILAEHGTIAVRLYLAKYHKSYSSILETLALAPEPNWSFRQQIHYKLAKNSSTPLEIIKNLLKENDKKVKLAIAARADLAIDLIIELALDYRLHMMNSLAQNTYISASVLRRLANHGTLRVRQMVARHPNTPQAVLVNAVSEPELCRFVAANPSAGENLLYQLAQNNQHEVLEAIAANPSTPASVLKHIAETRAHDLLVAQHPNANREILQQVLWRLAMDERLSVRKYAAKHPHTPIDILRMWMRKEPQLRVWIAQNPSLPVDMLEVLAHDVSPNVRLSVACNPSTPHYVLEKLSFDAEVEVRRAVASNIKTPDNALEILVKDWQCCTFLAQNKNAPAKVLEYLAGLTGFNWLLLAHPNTSVEMRQTLMTAFAKSYIESDRLYATQHPDTPVEILTELSKDKNLEIRIAALQALKKPNT
ncbi:hypothetical protein DSM106972_021080 [Dulcicalothrix desertica PCC 7102]|uniref:Leucine rich repeat variant domain-containing protein n=1 Tax=Dulcicalothrix desertica PCC 7102 TaxID=232991 RepID=A0A433VNZ7_9CYAN|nr:hypothetical protein [Dulcicalothrix desertica]RUT07848.1 hypothetical protein DSM106972_021080 [Dulcicalothrix desertica PCC 7102]TWH39369.1 hypothetical protein CAL7102_08599 [Dulcicalothrix desertica PCC 7102]